MMTLWIEAIVAIACIYAAALGLWPILVHRSERFAQRVCLAVVVLLPFVGLIVEPWSVAFDAKSARVLLSILGALVGGLLCVYWRSSRRHGGFRDYARFILLGLINPNLINSPRGFSPRSRASVSREVLRLSAAIVVGGVALVVGGKLLGDGDARYSWIENYLIAVVAFVVIMQAFGQALWAVWRMMGYRGRPLVDNVWLSRTPAEFWRRWSRPAHLALYRYVYLPCGGRACAMWAIFTVFLVSGLAHEILAGVGLVRVTGHQFVFFMLSCLGVMASPQLERLARWGVAGETVMRLTTVIFMLATGTLMFATFNNFVPLYQEPAWLAW